MTDASDDNPRPERLGTRYEILDEIGSGGYGTVHRAHDAMTDQDVAIKVLDSSASKAGVSAWREAASLRRLNLPGVVQLLDEGIWGDRPYLVMPIVDGAHFPGDRGYGVGELPTETILALVELLTLVHSEGIIHGDLKPQNVLVGDDGRVTLLDFGTGSWTAGHPFERRLKRSRGTPAYMSPEQLRGHRATVHSDYYALGVMLYHVITGEFPHPIDSIEELTRARLSWRAPRIDPERFEISAKLARAVEGLLAPAASRRLPHLRDLVEALDTSRAEQLTRGHFNEHTLAFLDPHGLLDQAVAVIERGESVDVVGRKGSGKTRFLHELTHRLRNEEWRVISLIASTRAFGSLAPLIGTAEYDGLTALDDRDAMHRRCREVIEQALEAGKVLVADNLEKIDPRTRELLEIVRDQGGIVRAIQPPVRGGGDGNTIELQPFSSEELEQLFDGPEPIFRARSEAAHQLWLRSGGRPRALVREVDLWVRHGLAHFRADKIVVPTQQLERLRRGLQLHTPNPATAIFADDIETRTLLVWIKLAGEHADIAHLAPIIGVAEDELRADVQRLIERDALTYSPEGVLVPMVDAMANCPLSTDEIDAIHHALASALSPGTPERLLHLLRAGDLDEIIDEARASAQYHDQRGEVGMAIAALTEAVWACHQFSEFDRAYALVSDWAKIALATSETTRLEELLYVIEQLPFEDPQLAHLEALVNLGRIASQRADEESLERLEALEPFEDWELELRRHMYRFQIVLYHSTERSTPVLEDIEHWIAQLDEPEASGTLAGWKGHLAFQNGEYASSARQHIHAARIKQRPTARLASLISASTALMDGLEYADALSHAQRALELAEHLRHHYYQAYCLQLIRDLSYRRDVDLTMGDDLVQSFHMLGKPALTGKCLLTEAAIQWRNGRQEEAERHASEADELFKDARNDAGQVLSRALAVRCGKECSMDELDRLAVEASRSPSATVAIQVLGLLIASHAELIPRWKPELEKLASTVQAAHHDVRREILSVSEAMAALG
jgi:energy-coupling factor transporter ATP-binding protein EcfA2